MAIIRTGKWTGFRMNYEQISKVGNTVKCKGLVWSW